MSTVLVDQRQESNQKVELLLYKGLPAVLGVAAMSSVTSILPFLLPFTGPLIVISIPLMILVHAALLRFWLINPPQEHFSLARRMVSRWIPRLLFLVLAPWGYGMLSLPWVGLFAAPIVFVVLNISIHRYIGWHMQQQDANKPIHLAEKLFLGGLVATALSSVALFATFAYMAGVGFEILLSKLGWLAM